MMEVDKKLKDKLSKILGQWCATENKRKMYGFERPQAVKARGELAKMLKEILQTTNEFLIVRKDKAIEVHCQDLEIQADTLQTKGILSVIADSFEKLNISSITFKKGLSQAELDELFSSLNNSNAELEAQGGIASALGKKNVTNIQIDQKRFALLEEGQEIGRGFGGGVSQDGVWMIDNGGSGSGSGSGAQSGVEEKGKGAKKESSSSKKEFFRCWSEYMGGERDKQKIMSRYEEFVGMVKKKPIELIKVLKKLSKKQKDIEVFLASIEDKLTDLGFSEKEIDEVKKKISEPKKVSIGEDELMRLRRIEENSQKDLDERIEESLKEVKKINKKLTYEKERINSILRQGNQGVIVINKEGKILSLNGLAEKTLGVSLKVSQQKDLKSMIKEGRTISITSDWQKETDEYTPKDIEVISSDDKTRDKMAQSSAIVEDENGKPIGTVVSLPETVAEEQIKKQRNDIMDVLAHDVRVPVYNAKHSLKILMDQKSFTKRLDEKHKNFLTLCQKNIDRMEKLVHTIMDVRQLETGKIILKKEEVNISRLIEESVGFLKVWASEKKIKLHASIKKLPKINLDPDRMYQVISNLISNALKFTPSGGEVRVNLVTEIQGKQKFAKVIVSDSGIGIKKDDLVRVFKKYEQVKLEAPKGERGLGLGLAICSAIIELHNGKIWVQSNIGRGSEFMFTLPIEEKQKN